MTKTIVVSRAVYNAAQKSVQAAKESRARVFSLLEKKMQECESAGNTSGELFWGDVYIYLSAVEYLGGTVEIIEDGSKG